MPLCAVYARADRGSQLGRGGIPAAFASMRRVRLSASVSQLASVREAPERAMGEGAKIGALFRCGCVCGTPWSTVQCAAHRTHSVFALGAVGLSARED